jgi:hypothetical protein
VTGTENPTEIVLATGDKLRVRETPDQIENAIAVATTPHIPLIKVTETGGQERRINIAQIVEFHAPTRQSGVTFT